MLRYPNLKDKSGVNQSMALCKMTAKHKMTTIVYQISSNFGVFWAFFCVHFVVSDTLGIPVSTGSDQPVMHLLGNGGVAANTECNLSLATLSVSASVWNPILSHLLTVKTLPSSALRWASDWRSRIGNPFSIIFHRNWHSSKIYPCLTKVKTLRCTTCTAGESGLSGSHLA